MSEVDGRVFFDPERFGAIVLVADLLWCGRRLVAG